MSATPTSPVPLLITEPLWRPVLLASYLIRASHSLHTDCVFIVWTLCEWNLKYLSVQLQVWGGPVTPTLESCASFAPIAYCAVLPRHPPGKCHKDSSHEPLLGLCLLPRIYGALYSLPLQQHPIDSSCHVLLFIYMLLNKPLCFPAWLGEAACSCLPVVISAKNLPGSWWMLSRAILKTCQ